LRGIMKAMNERPAGREGYSMDLKEIGARVRQARTLRGLSQAALAQMLRISAPFLSNIEQGKQVMSSATLYAICEALNVSADWVLRCRTPAARQIADEELAQLLEDCTPAEKAAMLRLLRDLKDILRAPDR